MLVKKMIAEKDQTTRKTLLGQTTKAYLIGYCYDSGV